MSQALGTILQLATSPKLLGPLFAGPSWATWRVVLRALFALPIEADADVEVFRRLTGRERAPRVTSREAWILAGRRGGKSRVSALIAVFMTCCRTYRLAPGETGVFMVIAADRRQARVVKRYISGLLAASPTLAALKGKETAEAIPLTNGLVIEIHTASFRTLRGYTVIGAVCDEVAFWQSDDSANPDSEILTALRASTATVPEALILSITSPYARRGEPWRVYRQHFGKDDASVLVVQAATRELNPQIDEKLIEAAYAEDPIAAAAEWGAEFRRDLETFIDREVLQAAVVPGRHEIGPISGVSYLAFTDPAGGSGSDSFTLAIAHRESSSAGRLVLDVVREVRPPFSPEQTVADFSAILRAYRVTSVTGDRYAGEWPREQFQKHGSITYRLADSPKSDLYRDCLPLLNSGRVELLDHPRLVSQFANVERRTARGGRDSIDHAPRAHDDLSNATAGALLMAAQGAKVFSSDIWMEGF